MACLSGVTNSSSWQYTDCCGYFQSGSTIGTPICLNDDYSYSGITLTDMSCSPACASYQYNFTDCCDSGITFTVSGIPAQLVSNFYHVTVSGYTGCTYIDNLGGGTVYDGTTGIFVQQVSCEGCITCPTPTPTQTPTPTPSPTPTPTYIGPECPINQYCLDTNNYFDNDGTYNKVGNYNGYAYYTGGTDQIGYLYNTGYKWCLSDSLGGDCFLFGKVPCYENCPDISLSELTEGVCVVTPTPTPAICDDFDFNAYFNCEIITPTPTATISPTPTSTPTPTPTPTPTSDCSLSSISLSATTLPTPTPSATPTATPITGYSVCFSGDVTYTLVDDTFTDTKTKKLVDCISGDTYYVVDSLVFSGLSIETGVTFNCVINGVSKCVTYESLSSNSSNAILNDIIWVLGPGCDNCSITPTPTPTPTITPTSTISPTPTLSPTATGPTSTPAPAPTSTPMNTLTSTPTPTPTDVIPTLYLTMDNISSSSFPIFVAELNTPITGNLTVSTVFGDGYDDIGCTSGVAGAQYNNLSSLVTFNTGNSGIVSLTPDTKTGYWNSGGGGTPIRYTLYNVKINGTSIPSSGSTILIGSTVVTIVWGTCVS